MTSSIRTLRVFLHLFLIVFCVIMAYPVIWTLVESLKPNEQVFNTSLFTASEWSFKHYVAGWKALPQITFGTFIANSVLVSSIVVVANTVSCSLVAFAFARLKFFAKSFLFATMLVTMMLPSQVTLIPQYVLFQKLGWINSYLPITVPHFLAITPFFIFLMVQFIRGIPGELDEAAFMDGCNKFQIYYRVMMPLTTPALITTAIFSFIWTWDDFFSQMLYINDVSKFTVPLGLRMFLDQSSTINWGEMFAMSILSLIPSFLIFFIFQRYLVEGISTTGLKG